MRLLLSKFRMSLQRTEFRLGLGFVILFYFLMLLVDTSLLFTKVIEVLSIIILLIVWVYGMIIGRISLRESGTVQNSTIFQFHFLPILLVLALFLTDGNTYGILLAGSIAYCGAFIDSSFFYHYFPLLMGWVTGNFFAQKYLFDYQYIYGIAGAIIFFIIVSIINAILIYK